MSNAPNNNDLTFSLKLAKNANRESNIFLANKSKLILFMEEVKKSINKEIEKGMFHVLVNCGSLADTEYVKAKNSIEKFGYTVNYTSSYGNDYMLIDWNNPNLKEIK